MDVVVGHRHNCLYSHAGIAGVSLDVHWTCVEEYQIRSSHRDMFRPCRADCWC